MNQRTGRINDTQDPVPNSSVRVTLAAIVVLAGFAAALLAFELIFTRVGIGPMLTDGALTAAQAKSIDIVLDLSKLFMTWAIALIGGIAFFMKLNVEKGIPLRRLDLILAFAIILLSVLSVYFGHLALDSVAHVLAVAQSPLSNDAVRLSRVCQYITALLALGLFGVHVVQFYWPRSVR